MRVAFFISVLVMHTMGGNPRYRAAFQSQRGAYGEDILDPLWCFVTAMGQKAVIAHPDSKAGGNPPQNHREQERFPAEEKQSGDGADVKDADEKGSNPHDRLGEGSIEFKKS
jgi:hypothetical protein